MNKNLEATRAWYEEHDLLEEFYKKYVCVDCRYRDACAGVNGEMRMSCNNFEKRHTTKTAQSAWNEMSFRRYPVRGTLTQSQRYRRERGEA